MMTTTLKERPLKQLVALADSGTWGEEASNGSGSPVLRSTNIVGSRMDFEDPAWRVIPPNDVERRRLAPGDIIVTKSSGSPDHIGKCAVFEDPGDGHPYYFSNFMLRVRADESALHWRWLFYWLSSARGRFELQRFNSTTTGLRNLNVTQYLSQKIPLPPLSEQRRIADILDKADAIRRKRREAVEAIRTLPGSAFEEMFGVGEKSAKWESGTIRDLVSTVNYGTSAKAGSTGRHPILRMNNITYSGEWDLSDLKYMDLPEGDEEKYTVHSGDLLFNRTNSRELVGKTAVFREQEPMAFAGYLIRARTNERALPDYISGFLNSPFGKATLRHMCKSIIGMANINAQEFQDIKLPIPPISAQKDYAALVEAVRSREQTLGSAATSADELFASLVQRAFRGEL